MRHLYIFIWLIFINITDVAYGQSAPQLQWAFSAESQTPNAGEISSNAIAMDAAGNRYIAGRFQLTADFDPSPATFNLTATYKDLSYDNDSGDVFFAKYDPNGNLIWAKTIGGPDTYYGGDSPLTINTDNSGNIILSGFLGSLFDFDPSEAVVTLDPTLQNSIFVAKYDSNGNYLWAFAISNTIYDHPIAASTDSTGNIYLAGFVRQPADFDPSQNTVMFPSGNTEADDAYFVAKYNAGGNFIWVKALAGTTGQNLTNMTTDAAGQIILIGDFYQTVDFDPSPGIANLTPLSVENNDGYIAKYDTNGNYLWAKKMGGADANVGTSAVAIGQNGQIHIIGLYTGTVDFNPPANRDMLTVISGQSFFIAKYDSNGNYLWANAISGADDLYNSDFRNINITSQGQILIAGNFQNTIVLGQPPTTVSLTALGNRDFFIAKYGPLGNFLWAKKIGGTGNEYFSAFKLDNNENINITGNFEGAADFDPSQTTQNLTSVGTMDVFMAKYNTDGALLNSGIIGGYPTGSSSENENKTALGTDGAIYIAGNFSAGVDFDPSAVKAILTSESGGKDIFITKYTSNGNYVWAKSIRGIQSETMSLTALTVDGSNNLYIAGYFFGTIDCDPSNATATLTSVGFSDIFIAKYDSNGNYLWAKVIRKTSNFIDSNYIKSMDTDSNGNLYITGYFQNTLDFDPSPVNALRTSAGYEDIFIAKYSASGNYLWAKTIGSTWYDHSNTIRTNQLGQIYITGSFAETVDFDPSAATANLSSQGPYGMYFAKYDTNGNYLWVKGVTGLDYIESESLALNQNGQLYLSGKFVGSADFDPSANVAIHASQHGVDNFIAKYDPNGNYLWTKVVIGSSLTNINDITTDSNDNLLVVGDFGIMYSDTAGTTVTFDQGNTSSTLTTNGGRDLFITKYDTNGNYIWAKAIGGDLDEIANSIVLNSNDEMIITGGFMLKTDFDPSPENFSLTSINSFDLFWAKYKECRPTTINVTLAGNTLTATTPADSYQWIDCTNNNAPIPGATNSSFVPTVSGNYAVVATINGCRNISNCQTYLGVHSAFAQLVKVYPNPSSGIFNITLPITYGNVDIQVIDLTGKIIRKWNFKAQQELEIGLETAAEGIYFVQLHCDDETATFKVIKN